MLVIYYGTPQVHAQIAAVLLSVSSIVLVTYWSPVDVCSIAGQPVGKLQQI